MDYIDVETEGRAAIRTISVALKTEGNVVESESISGFVVGSLTEWGEMESTDTNIQLFDIIRDPGGAGSYSYIEKGSTYSFGYTFHLDAAVGINLQPTWGSDVSMNVGIVTGAVTAGTYTGQTISAASKLSFDLPIVFKWDNGSDFSYTFTTNERISTSSESSIMHVGTDADVYVGATMSRLVGKVKSVFGGNDFPFLVSNRATVKIETPLLMSVVLFVFLNFRLRVGNESGAAKNRDIFANVTDSVRIPVFRFAAHTRRAARPAATRAGQAGRQSERLTHADLRGRSRRSVSLHRQGKRPNVCDT